MRYKVDLKAFMAQCEANYQRLRRLFADMDTVDQYQFGLGDHRSVRVRFRVLKRSRYTTLLEMAELATRQPASACDWLSAPTLQVRLYHDARLAEVVTCETVRRVDPRYAYPNTAMHQPDEKSQWNRFLSEWLAACMEQGYAIDSPFAVVDGAS